MMKAKLFISLIGIGASVVTARAQKRVDEPERESYLDFGGSIGIFIPYDQAKEKKTLIGANAMTYLQLNYHRHLFAKLQFGQTIVNFKSQDSLGPVNSKVNVKANSTNLGMSIGYQHSWDKWQPFILAGAGASFIDVPSVKFDTNTNTVDYTTSSARKMYLNAGLGTNYKLSKSFVPFLEAQASTIPNIPKHSQTHLSGIFAMLGIKAAL